MADVFNKMGYKVEFSENFDKNGLFFTQKLDEKSGQ